MVELFYTDGKQEFNVTYADYSEFERSQLSCLAPIADHYKVTKLIYNGHELDYHDTMGNLYFYMMKFDRTKYE